MLTATGTTLAAAVSAGEGLAQQTPGSDETAGNETATNETSTANEEPRNVATDEAAEFRALLIPPEAWDRSFEGFFVHAGGTVDPVSAAGSDACEYADWPDQETRAYDVTLIEQEELLEDTEPTTLYVRNDVDVPPGALFMIMEVNECPESSYRGVYLQRVGMRNIPRREPQSEPGDVQVGVTNETDETDTPGAGGPGFGVLGTVAALAGAGGLLGRRWSRHDEDG